MINLHIQFRDLSDDGSDKFYEIKYPYIPRIGEEMNGKIFSKINKDFEVSNVTYRENYVLIYIKGYSKDLR